MKRRRILASLLALVLVMSNVGVNLVTSWASQGGLVFRLDDDGTVLPAEKESSEGDEDPADSEEDNYDYLLSLLRNKETGELETYTTDTLGAELLGSRGLPGDLPGTWSGDNDEALTVYPDGSADVLDEGYVTVVFRYEPEETLPQEASEAESSSAPEETEAPKATDNDADEETAAVPETEDAETEPVEAESAPAEETTALAETAAETTAAVETESAAETVAAAETAASEAGEPETEATAPAETESAEETAAAAETTAPEESEPETEAAPENAPDLTDEIPLEAGEELSWVVKVYVDGPKLLALDDIADFAGLKAAVNGAENGATIIITASDAIEVTETLVVEGKSITITGGELTRSADCSIFDIQAGGELTLEGINLKGNGEEYKESETEAIIARTASPVMISGTGKLIMNSGAVITGFCSKMGGGLYVLGTAELNAGASVDHNVAFNDGYFESRKRPFASGGGIYVGNGGYVSIDGATINYNTCVDGSYEHPRDNSSHASGGGIYIDVNGTVVINDGNIDHNAVKKAPDKWIWSEEYFSDEHAAFGGGIAVDAGGNLTMNGGSVSYNTVDPGSDYTLEASGGGICIGNNNDYLHGGTGGTFQLNAGRIDGNVAYKGGGIYIDSSQLHMKNVIIRDNKSYEGAGVWFCGIGKGQFYATEGAVIVSNTAENKADDFYATYNNGGKEMHLSTRLRDGSPVRWYLDGTTRHPNEPEILNVNEWMNESIITANIPLHSETRSWEDEAALYIIGNEAKSRKSTNPWGGFWGGQIVEAGEGGGIACNGTLIMGEDKDQQLKVTKVWDNSSDETVQIPESLTVSLFRIDKGTGSRTKVDEAVLDKQNEWTYTFEDLSAEYDWTVEEESLPEGWKQQEKGEEYIYDSDDTLRTIEITLTNVIAEPEPETVSVTVNKGWSDAGYEANRPASVTVQLMRDGEPYGTSVTLSQAESWTYSWTGLEKGPEWTVEESEVPAGYTSSSESSVDQASGDVTVTITNTYTPPTTPPGNPPDNPPTTPDRPGTEIPDEPIPLSDMPNEMVMIEDEEVPLAFMAPMTGDEKPVGAAALFSLLALGMMGVMGILGFRKDEEA